MNPGDPDAVAPVLTLLNIALAAFVLALLLAFRTRGEAAESVENAQASPRRWRWGVWLVTLGLLAVAPAQVPGLLTGATRVAFYLAGYPAMYAGVFLAASATWAVPWPPLPPLDDGEE